ncbi:hypothetical protein JW978_02215 [Candidatus Dojkabacteria bacterium]|nr:hypothetical protein [Candidatus Dojkabacteria bacterium]
MPTTSYLIDPNTISMLLQIDDDTVIESEMQQYYSIIDKVMKAGVIDYMERNKYDEDEKELIKKKMDTYISEQNEELKTDKMLKTFLSSEDLQKFLAELINQVNKSYYEQYYPRLDQAKQDELADYIFEAHQLERQTARHILSLLDFVDEKKVEEAVRQAKENPPQPQTSQQESVIEPIEDNVLTDDSGTSESSIQQAPQVQPIQQEQQPEQPPAQPTPTPPTVNLSQS